MALDLSVIILTFNEELHIQRCIENVHDLCTDIFVVDSFSTDQTKMMAEELGAKVVQNKWDGFYTRQFNWALENLPIETKWVLRLDADEYLCPELISEIKEKLRGLANDVTGIVFKRRHIFLGRWIKRGTYPVKLLRLFKYGKARCEQRLMDEHIELLDGWAMEFDGDFADHNLNDIGWWIIKHNGYALREAVDLLDIEYGLLENGFTGEKNVGEIGVQATVKRAKKMKYARMPLFLRSFVYFGYRYFLKAGFMEGKEGFLWHFLQGWWYRTLVDAKILEIKTACGNDKRKIISYIKENYGINCLLND